MKWEDKDLLLKDLSGRLPYQPLCKKVDTEDDFCECDASLGYSLRDLVDNKIIIKPYLRPLSSMTEGEKIEYDATFATIKLADGHYDSTMTYKSFDFLNEHHLDYRGLIEKGLAIEVTNENNPYEN